MIPCIGEFASVVNEIYFDVFQIYVLCNVIFFFGSITVLIPSTKDLHQKGNYFTCLRSITILFPSTRELLPTKYYLASIKDKNISSHNYTWFIGIMDLVAEKENFATIK